MNKIILNATCGGSKPDGIGIYCGNIIEKIVDGKLDKYFQSICLLEQPFVKNPDQTIQELLKEIIAKLGENIIIRRFVRYQLGN